MISLNALAAPTPAKSGAATIPDGAVADADTAVSGLFATVLAGKAEATTGSGQAPAQPATAQIAVAAALPQSGKTLPSGKPVPVAGAVQALHPEIAGIEVDDDKSASEESDNSGTTPGAEALAPDSAATAPVLLPVAAPIALAVAAPNDTPPPVAAPAARTRSVNVPALPRTAAEVKPGANAAEPATAPDEPPSPAPAMVRADAVPANVARAELRLSATPRPANPPAADNSAPAHAIPPATPSAAPVATSAILAQAPALGEATASAHARPVAATPHARGPARTDAAPAFPLAGTAPEAETPVALSPAPAPTPMPLVHLAAANPASLATPAAATAPANAERVDFTQLVDTIARAREHAGSPMVQATLSHAEFGAVAMKFRHDGDALAVSMTSADPGFAAAAAGAAQQAATDAGQRHEQQAAQRDAAPQAQARDNAGTASNSQGFAQGQGQAGAQGSQGHTPQAARRAAQGGNASTSTDRAGDAREQADRSGRYA